MCVIVYKPKDVPVDLGLLRQCWEKNSDGAGLMYPSDGELTVAKGFLKWRKFKRYVKRRGLDNLKSIPVAFHFRIATHGGVTEENTHPFKINDNLAMMHNGVIRKVDKFIETDESITDSEAFSRRFVRDAFSSITITCLESGSPINDLFYEYIGSGNKLLFMDNSGDVAIVNESAGTWVKEGIGEGMWFSNTLWKPYPKTSYTGRTVTRMKNGKSVTERYDQSGKLVSTTINPSYHSGYSGAGYGYGGYGRGGAFGQGAADIWDDEYNLGNIADKAVESASPSDNQEWYCYNCAEFFALSDAKRSYWTNGLKERIVDCPLCGEANTSDADEAIGFGGLIEEDEIVTCYSCDNEDFADELDVVEVNGETRHVCGLCNSTRTYTERERDLVVMFGSEFFEAPITERRADVS